MARLYEMLTQASFFRGIYRRVISGILRLGVKEGVALDLGTGPGYVSIHIGRHRPQLQIVGLDLAAHMVRLARRSATSAGLNGRGLWPQADAHHLPFPDQVFDLVFSTFALHHWQEPVQILNEVARVLAPGGQYYIADLCRKVSPIQRMFAYGSIPVVSSLFGSYRRYGGYYESVRAGYTRQEAVDLLAESDLPPGKVFRASTWIVPILVMSSRQPNLGEEQGDEPPAL
jgi:ubiquinone/menaquinone biosynthesis C-methylase UbiE